MKHPERVEDYLEHIAEAIERATAYLQSVPDLAAFKKNLQAQDAVVRKQPGCVNHCGMRYHPRFQVRGGND